MEPIINSQLPEFKVQAFQDSTQRRRKRQLGYFLLLSGRL